jgi:hypothetical protein
MKINDPEVVAELSALYPRYEEALVNNDVEMLLAMFWAGPQVMRFGVSENLYGAEDLEAFRKARPATNLARVVTRLDIVSFGRDLLASRWSLSVLPRMEPSAAARARCGFG